MKIIAISDIHGELKYIEQAAPLLRKCDFCIIAGDISKDGSRRSAEIILQAIEAHTANIMAVHGNWDKVEVQELLEEKGYSLHSTGKRIGDTAFFGVGGSSPTPMNTATEYSEEDIHDHLIAGLNAIKNAPVKILVTHAPPRKTKDRTFLGLRGGSRAVREFIENQNIQGCICGHIHEAYGIKMLKDCLIANCGSFAKGRYCLMEINNEINADVKKIKNNPGRDAAL